ncbi:MAG: hypothetical protein HY936_06805 [Nitrosomonadales bacterium]|nr:hypothetical protein [Nitrosomonadales bacterium]
MDAANKLAWSAHSKNAVKAILVRTQKNDDLFFDGMLPRLYKYSQRPIKVTRFFELITLIEKNKLWPEVKKWTGGDELTVPVRIQVDTLLLNAVKIALYELANQQQLGNAQLRHNNLL